MFVWLIFLAVSASAEEAISSYSSPVGTSYTVPLTNSYSAPVPKNLKYSVSAEDLDSSASNNRIAPVYSSNTQSYSSYGSAKQPASSSSFSKTLSSSYNTGSKSGSVYPAAAAKSSVSPASGKVVSVYSAPAAPTAQEKSAVEEPAAGERSDVQTSYEAPAAAETYNAAPASTGHLYYYYYPVVPEVVEKADNDEIDPLVAILLPITVLVGFLALLSIVNVTVGGGRSFGRENPLDSTFGSFSELQTEVDEKLKTYYQILESESCMDRVVCELGANAKNLPGKTYLLSALDWIIPSTMTERVDTFKLAVNQGYDMHQCKKYACASKALLDEASK